LLALVGEDPLFETGLLLAGDIDPAGIHRQLSRCVRSVPVTTSVTTDRPGRWATPLGTYDFRHLQPEFLMGFRRTALAGGMEALLATPEKALLDLVYLEPDADSPSTWPRRGTPAGAGVLSVRRSVYCTLRAVSSMTNEVCSEESSAPRK
jgi:hypothetical protein